MADSSLSDTERESLLESLMATTGLRRPDAERLLSGVDRPAKRNPILDRQWVRTLHAVSTDLRTSRAQPHGLWESVFWIRLYGVLTELLSRFETPAGRADQAPPSWKYHRYFVLCREVYDSCIAVRDSLSDEELVYAAYLRQVHAHVYQEGFEYTVERNNPQLDIPPAVRTKQMVRTLRKHVPMDDVHAIVDRIFQANGSSDAAVAVAFAHKTAAGVDRLEAACARLNDERASLQGAG